MKIEIDKYIEADFDALWGRPKDDIQDEFWIAGFFCQSKESQPNDGLICYLPLQGEPEEIRNKHLSPVCQTPQEAINKAYKLWRKNENI